MFQRGRKKQKTKETDQKRKKERQKERKQNNWCDGSDGNALESGLKSPGFKHWLRQEKVKNIS